MKQIKVLSLAICLVSLFAFIAPKEAKVVAIVNKADWCSICKAHGGRVVTLVTENNKDGFFDVVFNDITNEETKKNSLPAIKTKGLDKVHTQVVATGLVTVYDKNSKKVLAQFTVANSDEEIKYVLNKVRESVK